MLEVSSALNNLYKTKWHVAIEYHDGNIIKNNVAFNRKHTNNIPMNRKYLFQVIFSWQTVTWCISVTNENPARLGWHIRHCAISQFHWRLTMRTDKWRVSTLNKVLKHDNTSLSLSVLKLAIMHHCVWILALPHCHCDGDRLRLWPKVSFL